MKIIYFLLVIFWVSGLFTIYNKGEDHVEERLIASLKDNEREVTQLLGIAIAYNDSVKDQLISNLGLGDDIGKHPLISDLKDFPELKAYGLQGNESINNMPYKANLTGIGSRSDLRKEDLAEINAALALNLSTPIQSKDSEFIWSYYTSTKGFMLLAPRVGINDFHFSEYIYSKPFWSVATPEFNPKKETVVSDLYDDAAGQGLMISISAPVYFNDVFKGVVSLDVGLNYLNKVLHSNVLAFSGISLISREGKIIANKAYADLDEVNFSIEKDHKSYKLVAHSEGYYVLSDLIKEKFYVVYQLSSYDLKRLVFKYGYGFAIILTLFLMTLFLVLNLISIVIKTKKLAAFDGLSQLQNRMTWGELSNEAFEIALTRDIPISIIMIDIDFFKNINDQFGHHIGDKGIIHVASIIQRSVRKTEIVGRYGGEEFCITMPNTDIEKATLLAERIRKDIEASTFDKDKKVTVSIGIAEGKELGINSVEALCKKADLALYMAKETGRNCSVKYNPEVEKYNKRVK